MTVAKLIRKLDGVFSEYIRRRDSDKHTGLGRCCTCGGWGHWQYLQNGHFLRRGHHATRYDDRNNHAQCPACNELPGGNASAYRAFMVRVYGQDIIDELEALSRTTKQFRSDELLKLIETYQAKLKEMR